MWSKIYVILYCWSPPYLYRIEYRQLVVTLFFLKRLNDIFEENADELEREGKSQKKSMAKQECEQS